MPRSIDYYYSVVSPWAYIGHELFQDVVRRHGVSVVHKPVTLGELFSETGGLPLAKRHPARQAYRMLELQRWREKRGLSFHMQPQHWPFNAKLADGLIIAALAEGLDPEPFLRKAYAGVWEDQLDLGDSAVLKKLASQNGLPEMLVDRAGSDAVAAAYEKNRQDAIAAGVFGSPAYVMDGEVFWGQDRIELLDDALKSGRKPYSADVKRD